MCWAWVWLREGWVCMYVWMSVRVCEVYVCARVCMCVCVCVSVGGGRAYV